MNIRTVYHLLFLLIAVSACKQKTVELDVTPPANALTAAEAVEHIGEEQSVYGLVVRTEYFSWVRWQPTFINLDESFPNQIFTVVIWGVDREKFGIPPEERFMDKMICVTGLIEEEGGIPQIEVSSPSQIQILATSGGE